MRNFMPLPDVARQVHMRHNLHRYLADSAGRLTREDGAQSQKNFCADGLHILHPTLSARGITCAVHTYAKSRAIFSCTEQFDPFSLRVQVAAVLLRLRIVPMLVYSQAADEFFIRLVRTEFPVVP